MFLAREKRGKEQSLLCFSIIRGLREVLMTQPTLTLKMNKKIHKIILSNILVAAILAFITRNYSIIKDWIKNML
jgi:hypothetical protein